MIARRLLKESIETFKAHKSFMFGLLLVKLISSLVLSNLSSFGLQDGTAENLFSALALMLIDLYLFALLTVRVVKNFEIDAAISDSLGSFLGVITASLKSSLLVLAGLIVVIGAPYLASIYLFVPLLPLVEDPKEGYFKRSKALMKNRIWFGIVLVLINMGLGILQALLFGASKNIDDSLFTLLKNAITTLMVVFDLYFDLFVIRFYMNQTREVPPAT